MQGNGNYINLDKMKDGTSPIKTGFSVSICDAAYKKYGGHNQWLANLLRIDYLTIGFAFGFGYYHGWYDGQHHNIMCGLFFINWGGYPYNDL